MSKTAYIGLGANLGDPIENMVSAKRLIGACEAVNMQLSSKYYATSPVGYDNQPDFINCVVELQVGCSVRELFGLLQQIELSLGRTRDPQNQNAARLIDIDLLWFDGITLGEPDLIVPHPRMHQRLFVLEPLRELNETLAEQFRQQADERDFDDQRIFCLSL